MSRSVPSAARHPGMHHRRVLRDHAGRELHDLLRPIDLTDRRVASRAATWGGDRSCSSTSTWISCQRMVGSSSSIPSPMRSSPSWPS